MNRHLLPALSFALILAVSLIYGVVDWMFELEVQR
jgi:hypothetical protein